MKHGSAKHLLTYHSHNPTGDPALVILFWHGFADVDNVSLNHELVVFQSRDPVDKVSGLVFAALIKRKQNILLESFLGAKQQL